MRNFIFCFFIIYSTQAISQKNQVKELTINNEIYPILKSLYGKIEVVDNRENKDILIENDTTGRFHLKSQYALNPELKIQLEDFYQDHIGSISQYLNKKVLFVIQDYNVYREGFTNGSLYNLRCRGDLFLQERGKYLFLKTIDTILISSGGENIKNFFNNKSRYIYDFMLAEAETIALDTTYYSRNFAINLDSFFKLNSQLYNSSGLTDGAYYSYNRLAKSLPNVKFIKGNKIQIPKTLEKFIEFAPLEINKDSVYAIVNDNKLYINYQNKLYEGQKDNGEYYFQIAFHSKKNYYPATVLYGGIVEGLIGGLIWHLVMNELTPEEQILLETQLNCRNGHLKPTRQISNHKNGAKIR